MKRDLLRTLALVAALISPAACTRSSAPLNARNPPRTTSFASASMLPEPAHRNVIVQLFNWRFVDITAHLSRLRAAGYSHVHVSPPQKSNERVWQWWGRYQPVDFSRIEGPLGNEAEFRAMNVEADHVGIQIVVDVVANHTIDVTEMPEPDFVRLGGNTIVKEHFPQFEPRDFHPRCAVDDANPGSVIPCWLGGNLCDLRTETPHVRAIIRDYLRKLASLGVDGFRFDAAKHIEPEFFADVLQDLPNAYSFGEVITASPKAIPDVPVLDFYDFPLTATMKQAFDFGGNLQLLRDAARHERALEGTRAVTFVRNHDIDRGQAGDRGLDPQSQNTFGIGWRGASAPLAEDDIVLAYAYIMGREEGLPYVFADMIGDGVGDRHRDVYDDPRLLAFIRFHNLSLADEGGVARRPDVWLDVGSPNAIAWQRGTDRLVVINKAAEQLTLRDLGKSLQPGRYIEVVSGSQLDVEAGGRVHELTVPGQTAVMFVRQQDSPIAAVPART